MDNISPSFRKYNISFWILFSFPFILLGILFVLAGYGKMGYMPRIEDLENPKINLATLILSDDGEVLGPIHYRDQNRTYITYDELPQHLVNALIATEDIRFYRHSGIDIKGTMRAIVLNGIFGNRSAGGGSTITQQLAKLLVHEPARNVLGRIQQKFIEYIIAIKLERAYTKNEIITLYFNQFDYLYNATGIHSASRTYFNVDPDSLRIEQAAMLVGMAKNPALYNPVRVDNEDRAVSRRNTVLGQMLKYKYIDETTFDSLRALPIGLDFHFQSHNAGLATYFRQHLKQLMSRKKPERKNYSRYSSYQRDSLDWETDALYGWCNKNLRPDGEPYNIYTDGLRIYSTINYRMQYYAEKAVKTHLTELQKDLFREKRGNARGPFSRDLSKAQLDMIIRNAIRYSDRGVKMYNAGYKMDDIVKEFKKPVHMRIFSWGGEKDTILSPLDSILYYKHFLHTGMMSMDPRNGHVRAYVGGINFENFKYDHVYQSKRQAGSTFKPFLYILAMQEGYSPCRKVPITPITFIDNDTTWTPGRTGDPEDVGTEQTLQWGLAKSDNYVSAWLVDRFKPQPIVDIAHKMGIESPIDPVPSIIYGSSDVSVSEMVGAYGTFVNQGIHVKPLLVSRIEDKYGNILASFMPTTYEAISEQTSFLMLALMKGVTEFGTATHLRYAPYDFTAELAGKTGTTNDHADGWFMGVAPRLVTGVWVGAEERSVRFNSLAKGSGSNMALPIFGHYMVDVYADSTLGITQDDKFIRPLGISIKINCDEKEHEIRQDPFMSNSTFMSGPL